MTTAGATEQVRVTEQSATPWVPTDEAFGARLALVRQRMSWGNVKEAALACGLPVESWRTWERDNVRPRDLGTAARKIADRTGCDFFWLATGQTPARVKPSAWKERVPDRPADNRPNGRPREGGMAASRTTRRVAPAGSTDTSIVRPQRIVRRSAVVA